MQLKVTDPCYSADIRVEHTGLTWQLPRHFHHVEDKARRQRPPVSQFPSKFPPPEQPPTCKLDVPSWTDYGTLKI